MTGLSVALLGSTSVLAAWCLIAALLIGIGVLIGGAEQGKGFDTDDLFGYFWVGLAALLVYLHVWHFGLPLRWPVHAAPIAVGTVGLVRLAGQARRRVASPAPWRAVVWGVLAACGGLWLAYRATGPIAAYDTGMYHLPVVVWAKEYALVPGLGNLHGRLAFNNSNLLLAAVLDEGPWAGRSSHLVNGLLLFLLFLRGSASLVQLRGTLAPRAVLSVYDGVLLAPWLIYALSPLDVSSLTIEPAVAVAVFFTGHWFLAVALDGTWSDSGTSRLLPLAATLTVAVTFKLTAIAFAGVVGVFAGRWLVDSVGTRRRDGRRIGIRAGLLVGALAITWMARGIVLSGYPAFPSIVAGLPVEWKVPAEHAEALRAWIGHYGRYLDDPGAPYAGAGLIRMDWLPSWMERVLERPRYFWALAYPALLIAVAAPLAALTTCLKPRGPTRETRRAWWLLVPAGAALVFWFATAPRPEFASPFLWLLLALLLAQTLMRLSVATGSRFPVAANITVIVCVAAIPVVHPAAVKARLPGTSLASEIGARLVSLPRGISWPRQPPPARTERFQTSSGLWILVPTDDNRCWLADLPCTPHPAENLRLRRPGDLGSGFVTNGAWMQQRWPNRHVPFLHSWRARRPDASR